MRIFKGFLTCSLIFASAANAASLEALANEVTPLPSYGAKAKSTVIRDSKPDGLSKFAYDVGLDVSRLSDSQLVEIAADFGDKPSWSFCDQHQDVEIVMNANSLWERTKLMKLQRSTNITIVH
ncbi:hypothetical protein [Vibrio comitans]|uniref:Uncharacterized protein n=1 Tax=Vibrio comitans NBRC 102076 TaxID=1219078 RepID=A0A4Y3ISS9_9VIBR|nr:hypothetical protein [Vibrio comitans]GEA62115.1 hypothetical protein VCO01S_33080 [Vibrio comitans NBRC 102076]